MTIDLSELKAGDTVREMTPFTMLPEQGFDTYVNVPQLIEWLEGLKTQKPFDEIRPFTKLEQGYLLGVDAVIEKLKGESE